MQDATYIRWFSSLGRDDVATVGGKNASLGEMYQHLKPLGVDVPDGFALTAAAFRDALTEAKAWDELHALLDGLDKIGRRQSRPRRSPRPRDRLCRRPDAAHGDRTAHGMAQAAGRIRG